MESALRQVAALPQLKYRVRFSAGAVTFAKPLDSIEQMLQHADRVMYSVKHQGKGRVVQEIVA
jgi:PleD family two-component response regulator